MAFSDMYTQLFAAQKMKPKRHGAFKTFVVEGGGGSLKSERNRTRRGRLKSVCTFVL